MYSDLICIQAFRKNQNTNKVIITQLQNYETVALMVLIVAKPIVMTGMHNVAHAHCIVKQVL